MFSFRDELWRLRLRTSATLLAGGVVIASLAWWATRPLPSIETAPPPRAEPIAQPTHRPVDPAVFAAEFLNPPPPPPPARAIAHTPKEEPKLIRPAPQSTLPEVTLIAIRDGADARSALLHCSRSNEIVEVAMGDMVGHWIVSSIDWTGVTLRLDGHTTELSMEDGEG